MPMKFRTSRAWEDSHLVKCLLHKHLQENQPTNQPGMVALPYKLW